jgi:hypothetical protein
MATPSTRQRVLGVRWTIPVAGHSAVAMSLHPQPSRPFRIARCFCCRWLLPGPGCAAWAVAAQGASLSDSRRPCAEQTFGAPYSRCRACVAGIQTSATFHDGCGFYWSVGPQIEVHPRVNAPRDEVVMFIPMSAREQMGGYRDGLPVPISDTRSCRKTHSSYPETAGAI